MCVGQQVFGQRVYQGAWIITNCYVGQTLVDVPANSHHSLHRQHHTMRHLPQRIAFDHIAHHRTQINTFMADYRIDRLQLRDLRYLHAKRFDASQPILSTDHKVTWAAA